MFNIQYYVGSIPNYIFKVAQGAINKLFSYRPIPIKADKYNFLIG